MTRASTAAHRGAASTALAATFAGDAHTGEVLAVFPSATYLGLGRDVLSIETVDALRLPCAVLLPETTAGRPFAAIRPGDPVRVCASRVVAGPLSVDIVRHWRPRTARAAHGYDAGALAVLDATLPPLHDVGHAADELRSVLHAGRPTDIDLEHTIRAMLGLGGGLTPEGDDVLAGLLVGLGSRPRTRTLAARLASTVTRHAPGRTTLLSATLLKHAARGLAIPRLIDLVDALHPEGAAATARDAVVRLLAVGHTSGSALAHGVRAAATAHATTQHRSEVA